ncbi:hypothetical protein M8J77_002695 [Diaphorina citri]|nr:hypothetical protein M8J77_002695 [Diaphorina citri]
MESVQVYLVCDVKECCPAFLPSCLRREFCPSLDYRYTGRHISVVVVESLSAAEYAAPAWKSSAHCKQVNTAINEFCRIITGCLKPTPLDKLHPLAGIAPPDIRRKVAAEVVTYNKQRD